MWESEEREEGDRDGNGVEESLVDAFVADVSSTNILISLVSVA